MVGCFQAMMGKNKFLVKFKDGKKKEMSSCSLMVLFSKVEVDMDEPLSKLPKKEQGQFLIIDGYPEVEEPCMFEIGMYLSLFYCVCYVKEISEDVLEEQVSEERDPYLGK